MTLRERKKARTAAALFDAAVALLADRTFDDVTVDEICERAEVGRATFFRLYGSKDGLLAEFARRMAEAAQAHLDASNETSSEERLRTVEQIISSTWTESTGGIREIAAETLRAGTPRGVHNVHSELIELIADIVNGGQTSGEFRRATLRPDLLSWMLIVNLGVCVMDWLDRPDSEALSTRTSETLELFLAGLRQP